MSETKTLEQLTDLLNEKRKLYENAKQTLALSEFPSIDGIDVDDKEHFLNTFMTRYNEYKIWMDEQKHLVTSLQLDIIGIEEEIQRTISRAKIYEKLKKASD